MWAAASQAHGPVPAGTTVPDCPSWTDRVGPFPSMFSQGLGLQADPDSGYLSCFLKGGGQVLGQQEVVEAGSLEPQGRAPLQS